MSVGMAFGIKIPRWLDILIQAGFVFVLEICPLGFGVIYGVVKSKMKIRSE